MFQHFFQQKSTLSQQPLRRNIYISQRNNSVFSTISSFPKSGCCLGGPNGPPL
nr:MAG TPA: hypothetical protein [Bacteriophage sp.]